MKIAILGAGNVGATLGKKFAEKGHEIFYGVKNPPEYAEEDLGGKIGINREATENADVILLAVPFGAVEQALQDCGDLDGKIIVDATNPLAMGADGLHLTVGFETSGAEINQKFAKGAKLVKCFNQTGFNIMENPANSMMFVCGDDAAANETVKNLAAEIGFEAINVGDLTKARLLEPLAMLWIHLAFTSEMKRDFAFSVSRR